MPADNQNVSQAGGKDISAAIQAQLASAVGNKTALNIVGGNTKAFYGRKAIGEQLSVSGHRGIVNYEPTELVLTARCGTPLAEIEQVLAKQGQMLAFEPPYFGLDATIGGTIACGMSGPRRPFAGSVRDAVLGVRCINGKGESLHFGGEMVKNVAGFDVSRLMVGSMGTLGVLLDVSMRVMPRPEVECTLAFECDELQSIESLIGWRRQALPISASSFDGELLCLRLSGTQEGVEAACSVMGGEQIDGREHWLRMREQHHEFFDDAEKVWRLSLPTATPPLNILGDKLIEWGGAQRWLKTSLQGNIVREITARAGGQATLFRGGDRLGQVFHPLSTGLMSVHQRLKTAFDPYKLLNPSRMFYEV